MSTSIEEILGEAAKLEKKYEWLQASELYGQALGMVDEGDHFRRGEIQEKIGHSLRRAAFQAECHEEFRDRMQGAIKAYEKAYGFYEKLADELGAPWMFRCRAVSKDLNYWLTSDPSEKRRLLDECLELEEMALKAFWDLGNKLEYGRTYNVLPLVHYNRYILEWNRKVRENIFNKAIEWGKKAVAGLSKFKDLHEYASGFCTLNLYLSLFHYWHIADLETMEQHRLADVERFHEAVKLSERVGDSNLVGLTYWNWGIMTLLNEEKTQHYMKTLERGEETHDILLKGIAQDHLAHRVHWKALQFEDPDHRIILTEEAIDFYDKGQQHLSVISYLFRQEGMICPPGGYAEHYFNVARWETNQKKKKELLEKAEKEGLKAIKIAENSDLPAIIDQMCHYLSKTLQAKASLVLDKHTKRSLLDKAMKYRERNIDIEEQLVPFNYWRIGVWYFYLALIQKEFADVEPDLKDKRKLLEDAQQSMEKCLEKIMPIRFRWENNSSNVSQVSRFLDNYEVILARLYEVTNELGFLRKAVEISRRVIELASKIDMNSRIAESYWKIAKKYDILGEHIESANNFRNASESYTKAAEKIPQLKEFYQDHVAYMQAWCEIERARQHHKEKKYGMAKEHYEKAAELHETTTRWAYLSPNYQAWARLEGAEDLSRKEQTQKAREIFQEAAKHFVRAGESIKTKLKSIEAGDERKIAEGLVKASDVRREYCLGRMALEDARILDRQGDHVTSSERYGLAAEKFQTVIEAQEQESERRELQPIVYLSQAWQKMMNAEARASPTLYGEAAVLFMRAKDHALDQTTSFLAQAHSSFCRALEAGARFELNRDPTLFSTAKNHIEAATSYYLRAGYRTASDYARATSRLIDAYMYSYNAQIETDPEKKARFYRLAENLLEASASSYIRARHPEKNEEVQRILDSIKEERKIAASLMEALHAPAMTSTTTSFSTPTPSYEQAVGLERFEYADVQANLILREREVRVGEDLDLEIALVNAGKAPAQLIKVDEIIPEGFEVKRAPDICSLEDSYLDMKGRTLNPLKTEELRMILRPLNTGTFHLKPRILYLDESGKYKSHEPQPVSLDVRRRRGPPI
jgi:tetratricopeptide (TPR) repeat protein